MSSPHFQSSQNPADVVSRKALELLARREYGVAELHFKLMQKYRTLLPKGELSVLVQSICDRFVALGYLSDERFAESIIRSRLNRGFGQRRIELALQQKGLDECVYKPLLAALQDNADYDEALKTVWQKKFNQPPKTPQEKAKQFRFLVYRGFGYDQVTQFLQRLEGEVASV